MADNYSYKITRDKTGQVKVSVSITKEAFNAEYEHAVEMLASKVKVAGFRPGKAPKSKVESKVASEAMDHSLHHLLPETAAEIVEKEDLNPVTSLQYDVTKMSDGDGLEFDFTFTEYPQVKLGKLNNLKVEKPAAKVEQKDIDEVIQRLFPADDGEDEGEKKDKSKKKTDEKSADISEDKIKALGLPEVTDKASLEKHIRERLEEVKQSEVQREYENKLVDAAVAASNIPVPQGLLDQQTEALVHDYLHRIEHLDVDVDEFLEAQGITKDELREKKQEEAKKRTQVDLLMNQIIKDHDLIPTIEDIEAEINAIDDTEVRDHYDSPEGRRYILTVLTQQRGLKYLVEQNDKKAKK